MNFGALSAHGVVKLGRRGIMDKNGLYKGEENLKGIHPRLDEALLIICNLRLERVSLRRECAKLRMECQRLREELDARSYRKDEKTITYSISCKG